MKELRDVDKAIENRDWFRTRPVVMTSLMAALGFLPAAMSKGIGSESQKPLAGVVMGGLVSITLFTLIVFPLIYRRALKSIREK